MNSKRDDFILDICQMQTNQVYLEYSTVIWFRSSWLYMLHTSHVLAWTTLLIHLVSTGQFQLIWLHYFQQHTNKILLLKTNFWHVTSYRQWTTLLQIYLSHSYTKQHLYDLFWIHFLYQWFVHLPYHHVLASIRYVQPLLPSHPLFQLHQDPVLV